MVVRMSDNVLLEIVELSPGRVLLNGVFGFSTASFFGLVRVRERSECGKGLVSNASYSRSIMCMNNGPASSIKQGTLVVRVNEEGM